jgi:WD40 repeat protein
MAPALGVALHPSGKLMATCSCDQTAVVWSLAQRSHADDQISKKDDRDSGHGHKSAVDVVKWQSVSTILGHNDYVKAVAFRADGRVLATASRDRFACLCVCVRVCVLVCVLYASVCIWLCLRICLSARVYATVHSHHSFTDIYGG